MENVEMTDSVAEVVAPETLLPDAVSNVEASEPGDGVTPLADHSADPAPAPGVPKAKFSAELTNEPLKPRAMEEIGKEYQQCILNAGETQYQIGILAEALERTNLRLRQLNNEAAQIQAAKAKIEAANKENQAKQAAENLKKAEEKRLRKAA